MHLLSEPFLAQVNDWMNDIYPMWVRAHGIMIISPVNCTWRRAAQVDDRPAGLRRRRQSGSDLDRWKGRRARAKAIELAGWHYPRPWRAGSFPSSHIPTQQALMKSTQRFQTGFPIWA